MTIPRDQGAEIGAVLHELAAARVPWLALAMAGSGGQDRYALPDGGMVIDLTDPHVPPVMVNPLEPEKGYPVQAHADRVAGLFEAAFGLTDPVATAIRTGLRKAYGASGWDALTGAAPPAVAAPAAVPAFRQLRHAVLAAAEDLGYDRSMRAAVRGFVQARLEPLWAGPAGRFLEGGHPVDAGKLLTGSIVLTVSGLADDEALFFLVGSLLVRVAERLRGRDSACGRRRTPDPRSAIVVAGPRPWPLAGPAAQPQATEWLARMLEELRFHGAEVIAAHEGPGVAPGATWPVGPARSEPATTAPSAGRVAEVCAQVLSARRSAACGEQCTRRRPCDGYELSAAELLAHGDGQVWLRLWAETLLLAFLTGRPLPRVPAELRAAWQTLGPRTRECVLATILDAAVTTRATALRRYYDPRRLLSVAAKVAGRTLEGGADVPFRAGQLWVIPQLRWLHETERLNPLGRGTIRLDDIAPPLDFGLAGLPDWPGIRVRDRLAGLHRHPLSMESARNRRSARIALLGEDGRGSFDVDLATAAIGLSAQARLRYAARMMGVGAPGPEPGWLEVVLSWPHRIIRPSWHAELSPTATG
ncbi:MAG TPA: hypothetical protein VME19_10320 [Streptosporangiaceae bacterium]|nr:hypothetical protein [Streptosporangiaceae bacterium]